MPQITNTLELAMRLACPRCCLINEIARAARTGIRGLPHRRHRYTSNRSVVDVTGVPLTSSNMDPDMKLYPAPSTTWLVSQACSSLRVTATPQMGYLKQDLQDFASNWHRNEGTETSNRRRISSFAQAHRR